MFFFTPIQEHGITLSTESASIYWLSNAPSRPGTFLWYTAAHKSPFVTYSDLKLTDTDHLESCSCWHDPPLPPPSRHPSYYRTSIFPHAIAGHNRPEITCLACFQWHKTRTKHPYKPMLSLLNAPTAIWPAYDIGIFVFVHGPGE